MRPLLISATRDQAQLADWDGSAGAKWLMDFLDCGRISLRGSRRAQFRDCPSILARGTGPDNVTTQWSVNAIEQRTGISRPNADKAVKDLLARGIWKNIAMVCIRSMRRCPAIRSPGAPSLPRNRQPSPQSEEQAVPYESKAAVEALKARGIVKEIIRRTVVAVDTFLKLEADAIAALTEPLAVWLPNALIDGALGRCPDRVDTANAESCRTAAAGGIVRGAIPAELRGRAARLAQGD